MHLSEARIETHRSRRYLQQLCKHFAHKVPATYSIAEGRIEFPYGLCELQADEDILVMRAGAPDPDSLEKLQKVAGSHLERFAFREELTVEWRPLELEETRS